MYITLAAVVAKLANAVDSKSTEETLAGSSPVCSTIGGVAELVKATVC